jgi:hypothetical protein
MSAAPLRWPEKARVALCVIVTLEHLEWSLPPGSFQLPRVRQHLRPDLDARAWFDHVLLFADHEIGEPLMEAVCEDPDDDKYLAAALEGRAQYIVTGDRPFLNLGEYRGVRVVTPRSFLGILDVA